jgi:hypothetical protein
MAAFSSATSWRNCSTSCLVALEEAALVPSSAGLSPGVWASSTGATKNGTRRIKHLLIELMFFLSREDLTNYERDAAAFSTLGK